MPITPDQADQIADLKIAELDKERQAAERSGDFGRSSKLQEQIADLE
jgi:hypothetical protein